jgi:hypothetical protein
MVLPSNFLVKLSRAQNYNKAPIRILPITATPVRENGYIRMVIPAGCTVDLRTLNITYWCRTLVDNAISTTKLVGLPLWSSSLIQDLDIWIGGRCVQKFANYNFVYKLMQDYKSNYLSKCKEVGINADPSVYSYMNDAGAVSIWNTYTQSADANINGFANYYCWNDFIGFLGSVQPSIVNTDLTGAIEIHIRLADSKVLFAAGLAAESIGFEIDNVVAYIDKIDMKDTHYAEVMGAQLSSEARLVMPFKHYNTYLGSSIGTAAAAAAKNATMKITESTECLDGIILTFQDNVFPDGKQPLQLGDSTKIYGAFDGADLAAVKGQLDARILNGFVSANQFNYTNLLANNDTNLLNTSVYFKRNGLGLGSALGSKNSGTVQFQINSQDITHPLSLLEQHQQTLQFFELNEDEQKQINPVIHDLSLYERDFYACALSTSHINDKDKSTVWFSGLNTEQTSMNISVKFVNGRAANVAQNATPIIITCMTSYLKVLPGRNLIVVQ